MEKWEDKQQEIKEGLESKALSNLSNQDLKMLKKMGDLFTSGESVKEYVENIVKSLRRRRKRGCTFEVRLCKELLKFLD